MKESILKGVFVAAIAGAAVYFRELVLPVVVLAVVMSVDYISGMVSAWITDELSSRVGIMGIVKKQPIYYWPSWLRLWPTGLSRRRREK